MNRIPLPKHSTERNFLYICLNCFPFYFEVPSRSDPGGIFYSKIKKYKKNTKKVLRIEFYL